MRPISVLLALVHLDPALIGDFLRLILYAGLLVNLVLSLSGGRVVVHE